MQYVADPGDLLAKNIQISNLQIPLFIAWLHAKEQYFLRFVYFLQKLRFRHFLFLFLFFFVLQVLCICLSYRTRINVTTLCR